MLDSPLVLGVLFGASGAGATVGSLLHPWIAARLPALPLLCGAVLLGYVPRYLVLAAAPGPGWLVPVVFVSGIAYGVLAPLWLGLQYERVAPKQQSHAFGVTFALEQSGVALGGLAGGLLLQMVPVRAALLVLAVVALAVTAAIAVTRPCQAERGTAASTYPRSRSSARTDHVLCIERGSGSDDT